jgi:Bacterial Ig domain
MNIWTRWVTLIGGSVAAVVMSACALEATQEGDGVADDADQAEAMTSQAITAGVCTAVTLTSPTTMFTGATGVPITLSAVATCPAGSTPEFQFWVKVVGAANWTVLGPFVPGSSSWTPPSPGSWAVTAVTRAIGTPSGYQARAMSAAGTIGPANHAPTAGDDVIATTENVTASVDVLANDSDPDGDPLAVTTHTSAVHGAVTFAGTVATYTPAAGFIGSDSFTYTLGDGRGGTATATVAISVADRPPIANDDAIATLQDQAGSVNVLANDDDPDPDAIAVSSFTQGAHGAVAITSGIATYTPAAGFVGLDSFTYTIDDGHGVTATATVNVTVTSNTAACSIAITGPATGTFGAAIHLTASATCNLGAPEVQWLHRINSAYEIVQPFGPSLTLDFVAPSVGTQTFFAVVRSQGPRPAQATSNFVAVKVADNLPPCTAVRMVAPTNAQSLTVDVPATLTASATCPGGAPEFQFWVKPAGAATWTILPAFTTGDGSWTPPSTGGWAVRAVVRTVGSHVNYDMGSMAVAVTVVP